MKIINFSNDNFIKSYQFYAFPLGILANDVFYYKNWLIGRFLGVYLDEVIQFDELYYSDWEIIDESIYKNVNQDSIMELIKYSIDDNKVLHIWDINEKYIPNCFAYKNYDSFHDLLVVGYENENENLTIVNYGKDRFLSPKIININDLKSSFTNKTKCRSFKFIFAKIKILDSNEIINNIRQYIKPKNNNELKYYNQQLNSENNSIVGIYALKEYLNRAKKDLNKYVNINGICLLNEHKVCMLNTFKYLNTLNLVPDDIINEYKNIVNLSILIKNKYLIFTLKEDLILKNQIISNIEKMVLEEEKILNKYLKFLI